MTKEEYDKIVHLMKHGALHDIDIGRFDRKYEDVIPLKDAVAFVDLVYKATTMSDPIKISSGPKININVSDEEISDLKDLYATEPPSGMHYSLYYNEYLNFMKGMEKEMDKSNKQYKIKNIKFNGPKVIVFWESGDKTIVTIQDDENGYDIEKAIMAAYMKKALSNNKNAKDRSINNVFDKWIPVYEDQKEDIEAQINKVKYRKNKQKKR